MRILLDTCTFLWIHEGSAQLSPHARDLFTSPESDVFLSSVSVWEIVVKHRIGKLPLPEPPTALIPRLRQLYGLGELPLSEEAALTESRLSPIHRDPFDRMLICQAIVGGLTLLTPDPVIARYPVLVAW